MDLVGNPDQTKIVVATEHVAKDGSSKIVDQCTYVFFSLRLVFRDRSALTSRVGRLPLTGARVVSTIITELCVFEVDREKGGLTLIELAPGVTVEDAKGRRFPHVSNQC